MVVGSHADHTGDVHSPQRPHTGVLPYFDCALRAEIRKDTAPAGTRRHQTTVRQARAIASSSLVGMARTVVGDPVGGDAPWPPRWAVVEVFVEFDAEQGQPAQRVAANPVVLTDPGGVKLITSVWPSTAR